MEIQYLLMKSNGNQIFNRVEMINIAKDIVNQFMLDLKSRDRKLVYQRQFMMWYLRKRKHMTLSAIGSLFGKDHATVLHAFKSVEYYYERNDKYFFETVDELRCKLNIKYNEQL